jgi:chorismate mutase
MPDTAERTTLPVDTAAAVPAEDLAALRAEIDTLDEALHDLLLRRVDVVARLAASRAKGAGVAIRPGREAAILRRLLDRHHGPLPRAAIIRLWRELFAATTALQAPMTVAAWLPETGIEVLRAHLGLDAAVTRCKDDAAALAAGTAGTSALVALPPAGRWWRSFLPSRLHVTARLPFFGPSEATVFLLSPAQPDPSGDDRTLLRLPAARAESGLAAEGLPATLLVKDGDLALAEVPGIIAAGDVRLAAHGGTVLGAYAAPIPA